MSLVAPDPVDSDPRDLYSISEAIRSLSRFSVEQDVRRVTVAYTLDPMDDLVLADATGAPFTVTLPRVVDAQRKLYYVKRINGGANVVTVSGQAGENIDGALTVPLGIQYLTARLLTDGVQWWTV